jgi:sugar/nucleoside kinase (ribokinase family)
MMLVRGAGVGCSAAAGVAASWLDGESVSDSGRLPVAAAVDALIQLTGL